MKKESGENVLIVMQIKRVLNVGLDTQGPLVYLKMALYFLAASC